MIIKRAKTQGFCFGVAITVKKAEEAVARPGASVTTLGHVVHNPADGRLARGAGAQER